MKKLRFVLIVSFLVIFSGCSKTIQTDTLSFQKEGENYTLSEKTQSEHLDKLKEDLKNLNVEYTKDTKVAVIATSTANILNQLGMNIVACTSSDDLNEELKQGLESGEIINLGSALEPNMEQLLKAGADVVFVGSNMPHQENYDSIDNLVVLPQEQYYDIYYTIDTLINVFGLGSDAKTVFNEMVEIDQQAKEIAQNNEFEGTAVALKYAYGNITIAPNNTYIGSLLTEIGVPNLYGKQKDIDLPMSKEQLLLDNPDYIILYGKGEDMHQQMEELTNDEDLKNLKAYQNDNIIIVNSDSLNTDIDSAKTLLDLSEQIYEE